jgi:hypothetical protein
MDSENTLDIISIHSSILKNFENEEKNLENYCSLRDNLQEILSNNSLTLKIRNDIEAKLLDLTKKIEDVIDKISYNFFLMETTPLLDSYKLILNKPIKISFIGKSNNDEILKEKEEVIQKYLEIVKKFNFEISVDPICKKDKTVNLIFCEICKDKVCFESVEEQTFICNECGFQKEILGNMSSYKDVNRINLSSKYMYERKVHFKDCMNQYQGKQNSTIPKEVFIDLEEQFHLHGLLEEGKTKEEKFKKITKDHILLFLKETGHTKHYEDVFLIYQKMTGKKPDDISHLETKLMQDFETLSDLYDKKFKQDKSKKIDRKSFINIQYVLYQLLRKYKHPCKKEDFNILKTLDRKSFHDDIMKELFQELNWNFFSPQF